jgi:hypothetical protein
MKTKKIKIMLDIVNGGVTFIRIIFYNFNF